MKRLILGLVAISISFASASVLADKKKARIFQTADIQAAELETGALSSAEGAAWLKRAKDRVDGRVMARVDHANRPYSIWWVIFNNPDGCIASCGPADVFTADFGAAADVAVFNASGAISAHDGGVGGVINVDLSVIAGEGAGNGSQNPPMGAPPFFFRKFNKKNGLCAEIHVDINAHVFEDVDNIDWVVELTYPENAQAFAVFPPVAECKGKGHK